MAEFAFTLEAAPVLGGTDLTLGQNRITARTDHAIVSIATPKDGESALAQALKAGWSLPMPTPTRGAQSGDTHAIRTAPDQILLLFPHTAPDANAHVAEKLGGAGYTTDQTDVWVILDISGPDTLPALERLCPLDSATLPVGGAGRTVMEHMGAIILRLGPDRFWLLSASSSAHSFLHAVETSYRNVLAP